MMYGNAASFLELGQGKVHRRVTGISDGMRQEGKTYFTGWDSPETDIGVRDWSSLPLIL